MWACGACDDDCLFTIIVRRPQLAKGFMQLYSFEQAKSQALEAHAAAFATIKVRASIPCCLTCKHMLLQSFVVMLHGGCAGSGPEALLCLRLYIPQPAGRDAPCNVIAFAQKTLKDGQIVSKVHVIELGGTPGMPCSSHIMHVPTTNTSGGPTLLARRTEV